MTVKHARRVTTSLVNFLSDSQAGIGAACAAINTAEGDSLLPTTWTVADSKSERVTKLPVARVFWVESSYVRNIRVHDQARRRHTCLVILAVSAKQHTRNPLLMEEVKERLEWALNDMFGEDVTYLGYRLQLVNGTCQVHDAKIERITGGPARIAELNNRRAVVMTASLSVIVVEE